MYRIAFFFGGGLEITDITFDKYVLENIGKNRTKPNIKYRNILFMIKYI